MARKKTHEEFVEEVKSRRPHLLVLGTYINNETKLSFKCTKHNYIHKARPNQILNNGCPVCNGARKTTDSFKREVIENNDKVEIVGEYINNGTRIKCKCRVCGEEYYALPSCLLQGKAHFICSMKQNGKNHRRTHSDFVFEMSNIYGNEYSVVGEYKTARQKVRIQHNNCGYEWDVIPDNILHKKSSCPKCSNLCRRTHEEYIAELKTKQPTINCLGVFTTVERKLNYQCTKCNHIWSAIPEALIRNSNPTGCPICNGGTDVVICGVNDIWTTNPEMGKLLANRQDGYKYTSGSNKKVKWKCPRCSHLSTQSISRVKTRGIACKFCSDNISFPNKLMSNILSELGVNFESEKYFKWCKYHYNNKNKRGIYDFNFIHNGGRYIVEMDGYFHYNYNTMSGQTPEMSKHIDNIKDELAAQQGINVIRIDCESSNFEYIKKSILNSKLSSLFDLTLLDWDKCNRDTANSKMIEVWDLWNSGARSTKVIVEQLGLDIGTVIKYLKRGTSIGICDYSKEESLMIQKEKMREINKKKRKSVVCITTNEQFESIKDASCKYKTTNISYCCKGEKTYAGTHQATGEKLHWQYYSDYIKERGVEHSQ